MKQKQRILNMVVTLALWMVSMPLMAQYVTVKDGRFYRNGKEYRYVGANFWYGSILGSEGQGGNRKRLAKELDLMKRNGITNVRVLVGGDGVAENSYNIRPTLQSKPGVYNDTILRGMDYMMAELEKRQMTAVLYLNNAWEWSGGFGQYLNWAGAGPIASPRDWNAYQSYHTQFIKNEKALEMAERHVRFIVGRVNTVTGKSYSESPALMAWELANEPRAFGRDAATKEAFKTWVKSQASVIKSLDKNHLVTTGSEGFYGCEEDMTLFEAVHGLEEIDYACIHIWPFNWGWIGKFAHTSSEAVELNDPGNVVNNVANAKKETLDYLLPHLPVMTRLGKPLVIEEFGYPRDGYTIEQGTPTQGRDAYYKFVMDLVREHDCIGGCNFWAWGGYAKVKHPNWQLGDDYTGDPAQEEQGLNAVFSGDKSTLKTIKAMSKAIATRK